jgi:hypothetical protein
MKKRLATLVTVAVCLVSAAAYGAEITIGPVLELPGKDTMTVVWETDVKSTGSVICRDRSGAEIKAGSSGPDTYHAVTLSGLSPDTAYDYRVMVDGSAAHAASFTTLPERGPYRVIFMGDMRHNDGSTAELFSLMETLHPRFIVLLGDFVGKADREEDWKKEIFDPGKTLFDHIPVFGVPGNHDVQYDPDFTVFRRLFVRPAHASPRSLTFAETISGDLYIFLDIYSRRPFFAFTEGPNLVRILRDASTNGRARHIFVLTHEGVISYWRLRRGYSGLRPFTRVMAKYGVTAVISGHDHHYVRGTTYSGLPFFITGGGGSSLYDINEYNPYAAITGTKEKGIKTHHLLIMDVDGDTCTFSAVSPAGEVIDTKTIVIKKRP